MGVWGVSTQYESYDYVQVDKPASAIEGETWYDMDADSAKVFVDDAGTTEEMNVTDHGQLSNVSAGQHRSDSNIRTVVDGQVDAETVDGKHASDLGAPNSTQSFGPDTRNQYNSFVQRGSKGTTGRTTNGFWVSELTLNAQQGDYSNTVQCTVGARIRGMNQESVWYNSKELAIGGSFSKTWSFTPAVPASQVEVAIQDEIDGDAHIDLTLQSDRPHSHHI